MFNKITNHIYIRPHDGYTDRPNIGLIIGEKYTLLYDAGNSEAHVELLKKELKEQGLPLPDFVVLSHWHWDHSFGAHAWGVPVIAGKMTNDKLKEVSKWKWDDQSMDERVEQKLDIVFCNEMIKREYADRSNIKVSKSDVEFEGTMTIDLGDEIICELIHSRGPHSEDSVICYVPSEKIVFLGDSNCKDLYGKPWHFDIEHEEEFMENVDQIPYDKELVEAYIALLETLEFTDCVSGHADPMSKEELYKNLGEVIDCKPCF